MGEKFSKLRVSIEGSNALNYITMIKFIGLAGKRKLLLNKLRKSIRELPVNDPIELIGVRER